MAWSNLSNKAWFSTITQAQLQPQKIAVQQAGIFLHGIALRKKKVSTREAALLNVCRFYKALLQCPRVLEIQSILKLKSCVYIHRVLLSTWLLHVHFSMHIVRIIANWTHQSWDSNNSTKIKGGFFIFCWQTLRIALTQMSFKNP